MSSELVIESSVAGAVEDAVGTVAEQMLDIQLDRYGGLRVNRGLPVRDEDLPTVQNLR